MQDTHAVTLVNVKPCLQLTEYYRLVGSGKNPECSSDAYHALVEVYAQQVLSPNYSIPGGEEAVEKTKCD